MPTTVATIGDILSHIVGVEAPGVVVVIVVVVIVVIIIVVIIVIIIIRQLLCGPNHFTIGAVLGGLYG